MISADQSNVTVVEGQSVDLICQASGDPAPSLTWYDLLSCSHKLSMYLLVD